MPSLARGRALYEQQCALCHGLEGDGEGPAAMVLLPRPRDLTSGVFKLASTRNGVPTEDDLLAVLRRGVPGSAMPAWSWMGEPDLRSLALYVRDLGPPVTPGEVIEGPDWTSLEVDLARGAELFGARCAECHGERGEGRPDVTRRDADGTMNHARDFTQGVLKADPSREGLARRLQVGIHGTAMPAADLPPSDLVSLVGFVRSLIPHGSEDRLVQRRVTVRAERVAKLDLLRTEWDGVEEAEFALAPLWWRDDAVFRASVSALHDGETIALRVRWPDDTASSEEFREAPLEAPLYADGLAVQLSSERYPPFFGMGHGAAATNMWHWKAIGLVEAQSVVEIATLFTHGFDSGRVGHLDTAPLYQAYPGPVWIEDRTETVRAKGMNTLAEQDPLEVRLRSFATWLDGSWEIVLARSMRADAPGISLAPGDEALVSFAIWDGAGRDLRGQKSVSIWHVLKLAE